MSTGAQSDFLKGRVARFGQFELNVRTGELLRKGSRLKVQDQPLRVLAYLVQRPGELVTREELRSHLWPDGTFVDFEHSLNTAIKKLRQVLGDEAENSRFVETLPRRGYRFIAPVEWNGGTQSSPVPVASPASATEITFPTAVRESAAAEPSTWHFPRGLAVALGVVVLTAIALLLWHIAFRPAPVAKSLLLTPLTTYPGNESFGEISPDGERLVFCWDENKANVIHLFVKQIGTEQPLQITSGPDLDFAPTWSPDGRYIAFLRGYQAGSAGVYIIPALGGVERLLTSVQTVGKLGPQMFPNLSWSPDGKTLAFVDRTPSGANFAIMLMDIETLARKQLTFPPESTMGDSYPVISPDGSTVAFIRTTKEAADVYEVPIGGGNVTRITNEKRITLLGLAWTSDGKDIVYGGFGLWIVPARGGTSRTVMPVSAASTPNIRGDKLVFSVHDEEENIYGIALDGLRANGRWAKEYQSSRTEEGARFSPDGTKVAFQSSRSGSYEIWVSNTQGTNALRLTNYNGPLTGSPSWSPDGQNIIYDSRPNGNADIFVVGANGGPIRQLTTDSSDEVMPSFSRDGHWIYFASDRGGAWNVWKMPAEGGTATRVTKDGGFTARESYDGKYVYYAKGFSEKGIWRVPVEGGKEEPVVEELPPGMYGYWVLVKDGIYHVTADPTSSQSQMSMPLEVNLCFYSFNTKKTTKIVTLPYSPFMGAPGLEITPDRKRALVVMTLDRGSDIEMVQNFR